MAMNRNLLSKIAALCVLVCYILLFVLLIGFSIEYSQMPGPVKEKVHQHVEEFKKALAHVKVPLRRKPEPLLTLVRKKRNYTDAILFCESNLGKHLWTPQNEKDENIFTEWTKKQNFSTCKYSFLGSRFILDKQWHPLNQLDGPFSFGEIGEHFQCSGPQAGIDRCVQFINEGSCAGTLKNANCKNTSSCYVCQKIDVRCKTLKCFVVHKDTAVDFQDARTFCNERGQTLPFFRNYNEAQDFFKIIKNNTEGCQSFPLDMATHPVYEDYFETRVNFIPTNFVFTEKGIRDMCVVFEYESSYPRIIRENCTMEHCFICGHRG